MNDFGWNIFMMFLIFQGIISVQFQMPELYGYWDEFFFLVAVLIFFLKLASGRKHIRKSTLLLIMLCIGVSLIGLLGNVIFSYADSWQAIVRDIVGFLKFPITFISVCELGWDVKIAKALKKRRLNWLKWMTFVIFICGIINLFADFGMRQSGMRYGIYPYQFLFGHPTALVSSVVIITCLFCADRFENKYFIPLTMLIITIILSMRTKGIAFVAVYFFMRYGNVWLRKYRFAYWMGMVALVLIVSYSKLQLYASWTSSGREVLWKGSFILLAMCFPLGSGFGTYASHISGKYYSQVYDFIYSYDFWRDGKATAVLGDTGYPYYIGQFGFIGFILLMIVAIKIFRMWHPKNEVKVYDGLAEDLFVVYIAIALTSEAALITCGYEYGVVLAVLLKLDMLNQFKYRRKDVRGQ